MRESGLFSLLILVSLLAVPKAKAVIYAGAEAGLMMASMRPAAEETTPNFAGPSLGIKLGQSFWSSFNLSLALDYARMRENGFGFNDAQGRHLGSGIGMSMDLGRSATLGFSAHLVQVVLPMIDADNEDHGPLKWRGNMYGITLGRGIELSNDWMLEIALQYRLGKVRAQSIPDNQTDTPQRLIDTFSLTMTYLWKRSNDRRGWLF